MPETANFGAEIASSNAGREFEPVSGSRYEFSLRDRRKSRDFREVI